MSAEHDLNALNAAASAAATAGDFTGAVSYLRQVLDRQAATLGPAHADLATTLNNLALMLEQIGDTDEAGRCYRRAYSIALAALGPDDPAVGVSHANLAAFYRAHGSSGDEVAGSMLAGLGDFPSVDEEKGTVIPAAPRPAQVVPSPLPTPLPPSSAALPVKQPAQAAPAEPARRRSRAAVIGTAVVLLGAAGWWAMPPKSGTRETAAATQAPSRSPAAEPTPVSGAAVPAAPDAPPRRVPDSSAPALEVPASNAPATGIPPSTAAAPAREAERRSSTSSTRVAEARLCGALSTGRGGWRCQPLTNRQSGAAVYFYTRVASPTNAVVQHRWTRNGSVVRVVDLRIQASPKEGFRTYSRQTGRALEPGEWQVALVDPTGAVLQEESFIIK